MTCYWGLFNIGSPALHFKRGAQKRQESIFFTIRKLWSGCQVTMKSKEKMKWIIWRKKELICRLWKSHIKEEFQLLNWSNKNDTDIMFRTKITKPADKYIPKEDKTTSRSKLRRPKINNGTTHINWCITSVKLADWIVRDVVVPKMKWILQKICSANFKLCSAIGLSFLKG